MSCDEFQRIWQLQEGVALNADHLAETLQRHDRSFGTMIFWRDLREIGVSLVLIPIWTAMGILIPTPWTWWLEIPALLWVAGFMYVDRQRQLRAAPPPGASLRAGLEYSVAQVEHQIWLLRNILVWYLLPLGIPMLLFLGQLAGRRREGFSWESIPETLGPVGVSVGVFAFVYWLNQYAVRKQLEPLRQRLQSALDGLAADCPTLMSEKPIEESRRRMLLGLYCFLMVELLVLGVLVHTFGFTGDGQNGAGHTRRDESYSKRSPFEAVRWEDAQPEVQVAQNWYQLVSLNGIAATEIVDFSRKTYGNDWQKRFEEDLVELLSRMGHPPGESVSLGVQLPSGESRVLHDVRMKEANRQRIKATASAREDADQ
jgi:hypothetical protein